MKRKWHGLTADEVEKYVNQDHIRRTEHIFTNVQQDVFKNDFPHSLVELIDARATSNDMLDGQIFDCLTPLEREVIRLKFIERSNDRAIAGKMAIVTTIDDVEMERRQPTHATVQNIISRARAKLLAKTGQSWPNSHNKKVSNK